MGCRCDTDAMNRRSSSDSPQWPKLIGTAAASSLATLFVVRNFFPAEKKVRHSIRADYAVGDDTFVRTMGHLLGPPLLEGNQITPLENGDQIFPAMLKAIRSAQRTITFENFLFREGEVSDAFAQALAERARSFNFKSDFLRIFACKGTAKSLVFESDKKGRGAILRCAGKLARSFRSLRENTKREIQTQEDT